MQTLLVGAYRALVPGWVGGRVPVDAAGQARADEDRLADLRELQLLVEEHAAALGVDVGHHVLVVRRLGPQKRAGGGIERPDDAGLARDAGHDLAPRAGDDPAVQPFDRLGIRRHLGLDHEPGVRVVEVPFVVRGVLEVPHDLARVGVEREGWSLV